MLPKLFIPSYPKDQPLAVGCKLTRLSPLTLLSSTRPCDAANLPLSKLISPPTKAMVFPDDTCRLAERLIMLAGIPGNCNPKGMVILNRDVL